MFQIGSNPLEVVQAIAKNNKDIASLKIISHKVSINWRQRCVDSKTKISNLIESLEHPKTTREKVFSREEFINLALDDLEKLPDDEVWSLISLVEISNGNKMHIPMMNFHPVDISLEDLKFAIKNICKNFNGALLSSGRFFHYYGNSLLNENEWTKFMTDFLMPCVLVSPRYIGHRLFDGYSTLRLTSDKFVKTKVPEVIDIL